MLFDTQTDRRYDARGQGAYSVYEREGDAYVHVGIVHIKQSLRGRQRLDALDDAALELELSDYIEQHR
jgi:hypothetical protein